MQPFHGHVTFIQFKICCRVQNFTEIWRYIDFQNGDRPPSWNCFTTIRDHPRNLLPAAAACQISCQSDIHRPEDIAIFNRIFGLKCLFRPQNGGFGGLWTPKCDYLSSKPPKGTSLRKSVSFKPSTVEGSDL